MPKLPTMDEHADEVHPLKTQPVRRMETKTDMDNSRVRAGMGGWRPPFKAAADTHHKAIMEDGRVVHGRTRYQEDAPTLSKRRR